MKSLNMGVLRTGEVTLGINAKHKKLWKDKIVKDIFETCTRLFFIKKSYCTVLQPYSTVLHVVS